MRGPKRVPVYVSLFLAALLNSTAMAQQKQDLEPLEPPPLPTDQQREESAAAAKQKEDLPPPDEIIERKEGKELITEYRRFGQVYMIKIRPKNGPSQYMVDRDGDGRFETKTQDINEEFNLPKWRIGTW